MCVFFQPIRTVKTVSMTAKSAKPLTACFLFQLRTKTFDTNKHRLCSIDLLRIVSPERQVVTTNPKNHPSCYESVSAKHNPPHPNLE